MEGGDCFRLCVAPMSWAARSRLRVQGVFMLPTQRPPCLPLLAVQRDGSRGDATRLVELLRNNSVPSDLLQVRGSTLQLIRMSVQGSTLPGRAAGGWKAGRCSRPWSSGCPHSVAPLLCTPSFSAGLNPSTLPCPAVTHPPHRPHLLLRPLPRHLTGAGGLVTAGCCGKAACERL